MREKLLVSLDRARRLHRASILNPVCLSALASLTHLPCTGVVVVSAGGFVFFSKHPSHLEDTFLFLRVVVACYYPRRSVAERIRLVMKLLLVSIELVLFFV